MPSATHGSLSLAKSLPGATITFHAPSSTMREHRHEQPFLTLLLRGEYVEETDGSIDTVYAGDAVVHPMGERHRNRFSPAGAVCLNLTEANVAALASAQSMVPAMSSRRLLRGLPLHPLAPGLGAALLGGNATNALAAGLRQMFGAPACEMDLVPAWLRCFEALLQERFRDRKGLAAFARDIGCSPAHLARSYRHAFGRTVGQRIRELRIEWALDRMRSTREPLSQIAFAAGFADQAHMSRSIREVTGRTPSAVRRG